MLDRDQTEPELRAELGGIALFHRAPAYRRLRISTDACAAANCRWHRDPLGFGRDMLHGPEQISAPGSTAPCRSAPKPSGLRSGHAPALAADTASASAAALPPANVETRFRYNPDVKSLPAMVPAVIPLLLLMLPAMLTALAVVRERRRLDHQPLRDAGHAHRVPAGQAVALRGLAMVNFLLMRRRHDRVRWRWGLLTWRSPRCVYAIRHGHRPAGLGHHQQPERGHVLRPDRPWCPTGQFSGSVAPCPRWKVRAVHRRDLPATT